MKYFKFLVFVFLSVYFQVPADSILEELSGAKINFKFSFGGNEKAQFKGITLSLISDEDTEAFYSFDKNKSEFCCEREYTYESAHDMSEAESQRIVQNWLEPDKDSYKPWIQPGKKGQR
ncbi:MAG: hypothetical protein OXJ52_07945 [Oligoflexia bacterium]|nr:hypothetical protein [Oligoflexia bacterium]